jgi:hypothetical protein
MPHVLHTTALAKVALNRTHAAWWAPAKFGISPISRKLSLGNNAANAKGGMFFGIFGFFSHTLKYHDPSAWRATLKAGRLPPQHPVETRILPQGRVEISVNGGGLEFRGVYLFAS